MDTNTRKINIYEEAGLCLLCNDAPCTKACRTGDPARAIRAVRRPNTIFSPISSMSLPLYLIAFCSNQGFSAPNGIIFTPSARV